MKSLFPHLRAEGGGFLPLKIGITNDFAAFLTEHPETELTLDEWSCAISCITTRQVYLQRTAVAGIPRYGLDGLPAGQVSECDALNARRWLAVREQQKLKMKTMQEQSASTEKLNGNFIAITAGYKHNNIHCEVFLSDQLICFCRLLVEQLLLLVVSKQRYSDMGILQAIALQDQSPPP